MKIIFLDFDGVLNDTVTEHVMTDEIRKDEFLYAAEGVDHDKVMRLNRIIEATGAYIVITTSWKNAYGFTFLCRVLRYRGLKGFILGAVEHLARTEERFLYRADEIEDWLNHVPSVISYVILDDMPMRQLSDRHVEPDSSIGLQDEHVDQAVEILSRPL